MIRPTIKKFRERGEDAVAVLDELAEMAIQLDLPLDYNSKAERAQGIVRKLNKRLTKEYSDLRAA